MALFKQLNFAIRICTSNVISSKKNVAFTDVKIHVVFVKNVFKECLSDFI